MKAETKLKISKALKRYHSCCKQSNCRKKKKRRVTLKRVRKKSTKGSLVRQKTAGQKTEAKMLGGLAQRAKAYDKKYRNILF